jgi:hypothetical protein
MPLSCVVLVITPAVLFYVALGDFKEFKIAGLLACTVVRPDDLLSWRPKFLAAPMPFFACTMWGRRHHRRPESSDGVKSQDRGFGQAITGQFPHAGSNSALG